MKAVFRLAVSVMRALQMDLQKTMLLGLSDVENAKRNEDTNANDDAIICRNFIIEPYYADGRDIPNRM